MVNHEKTLSVLYRRISKKMQFEKKTNEYDGEYIFICNGPEDFSLYKSDAFKDFLEKVLEGIKEKDNQVILFVGNNIAIRLYKDAFVEGFDQLPDEMKKSIMRIMK